MMMKFRNLILLASLAILAGTAALAARRTQPTAPANSRLPLKEFMGHVFQRNAEQIWAWTVEEVDAQGSHSSRPVSDEDWENAESDALTFTELTYVLERSGAAAQKDPAWRQHIARLRSISNTSAQAAEAHDYPGLQKAANDLNAACVACHWRFAPALEFVPELPAN
jgi:hypothetical protein